MSTMSCVLIIALSLHMANAADSFEWKGVFYTPDASYKWGAQKVKGKYADPTMKLVAIPVSNANADGLTQATSAGTSAFKLTCEDVAKDGTIMPQESKCYNLVFDQSSAQTLFTIDASKTKAIAFFAQHFPTEFEDTDHYLKDTTGSDIEPVAQDPDPSSGGSHSHGHGNSDNFEGKCVCQAQSNNWKLDCKRKDLISAAVTKLEANTACKSKDHAVTPDCKNNYYVMQAHHDHCLHHQLPVNIEKILHDYEQFYSDCFVKRQFNPTLKKCDKVDCDDQAGMTKAIATLQTDCPKTAVACKKQKCADAIKIVLMAHDTCPEEKLPNNLETALHDYEDPCSAQLCNSADEVFDPYSEKCIASPGVTSRGYGSQDSLLVTTFALPFAVLLFL